MLTRIAPGCEPSYEELKPSIGWDGKPGAYGCEPSYEELKLSTFTACSKAPKSCEPSYEELKPFLENLQEIVHIELRAFL